MKKLKSFIFAIILLISTSIIVNAGDDVICKNKKGTLKIKNEKCSDAEVMIELHEADQMMVVDCNYIGDFDATSGWGNLAAAHGIRNAKKSIMIKAAKKGATHIVWGEVVGGYSPFVTAKGYICESSVKQDKSQTKPDEKK